MADAKPYPKASQLARGERRYRRKVASPKQWARIDAEKIAGLPCRLHSLGRCQGTIQRHHIIERDAPHFGDDVPANIMPLCQAHHERVTCRYPHALHAVAALLADAEYAYVVGKLGEGGIERLFGVGRS